MFFNPSILFLQTMRTSVPQWYARGWR